jgi:hypothetical protein
MPHVWASLRGVNAKSQGRRSPPKRCRGRIVRSVVAGANLYNSRGRMFIFSGREAFDRISAQLALGQNRSFPNMRAPDTSGAASVAKPPPSVGQTLMSIFDRCDCLGSAAGCPLAHASKRKARRWPAGCPHWRSPCPFPEDRQSSTTSFNGFADTRRDTGTYQNRGQIKTAARE